MEDVLDVYERPYDPKRPMVAMDETSKQLLADIVASIPVAAGHGERYDSQYERCGTSNLFMFFEPLHGQRHVMVTDQRTKIDWAQAIKSMVDEVYPHAEKIVLVMDNLNTHTPSSLYEAFAPEEAKRLADKLEIHYTPQARQLAQRRGDRTQHPESAMFRSSYPNERNADDGSCRLGAKTQRDASQGRLAIHHRRGAHQTQKTLSPHHVNI